MHTRRRATRSGGNHEAVAGERAKRLLDGFGKLIVATANRERVDGATVAVGAIAAAGNIYSAERGWAALRQLLLTLAAEIAPDEGLQ